MKKELNLQSKPMNNNNTQSHMKRKLFCLIAALVLCGTMWAQGYTQHYTPNAHGYETNCPITAKIQINGVNQNSTAIELGAFIGTEVRGSAFISTNNNNTYWIQVYYNPDTETGSSISFKAYNHDPEVEAEYTTCYSTLAANGEGYGSQGSPVVLNFLVPYIFTGEGNWSTATNWQGGVVPDEGNAVEINGNCTMDVDAVMASVTVNTGKTLTIPNGKTLTATYALYTTTATQLVIQEGGQLYGNVANAYATIEKNITAYTGTRDNYYFIASPLVSETPYTNIINLTENNYDLYMFDQSQTLEWLYIKDYLDEVPIEPGIGFLYANDNNIILKFSGELNSTVSSTILIKKPGNNIDFKGWNLVGNPFTHNINSNNLYIGSNQVGTIYQISGDAVVPAENVTIKPAEGFFVVANTNNSTLYFESDGDGDALPVSDLRMEVRSTLRDASLLDRAYVNFNQGTDMPKFAFGDNNVQLYIPQDGKELAVVRSEAQGEIPVNFKTRQNGSYTLNICPENMDLDYLHLIDNMTGADVDLLATPSYTFNAKKSDYASRFRLVFDANENGATTGSETFAYFNGSEWQISNMGEATLQVVDVMGRIVKSETISGNASVSLNEVPGVYMMRLVSGNDVKVQKVVVR